MYNASPRGDPHGGSDLFDLAVVQFREGLGTDFFEAVYDLDRDLISPALTGHNLTAYGALSEPSRISDGEIVPTYAELGFVDAGNNGFDAALRTALAKWNGLGFFSLAGMSGAPVFNNSSNGISGMITRGHLSRDGSATIQYLDIADILEVLRSVHEGVEMGRYIKVVPTGDLHYRRGC